MATAKYPIPDNIGISRRLCWCGSAKSVPIADTDRWGQRLLTVMCSCGTIRLDPRMTASEATRYYREAYPERQKPVGEFFLEQQQQYASKYLRRWLGVRVLDYGCGPGGKLADLVDQGYRIFGEEPNPEYMKFAVSQGIFRGWPEEDRYDSIYLSHTLEHWTDFDKLPELLTTLVPGGRAIIEVPLIDRLLLGGRKDGLRGDIQFPHIWYFSVRSLDKLMGTLGFQREYTDRLTLCVYRKFVKETVFRDELLLKGIELCSTKTGRLVAGVLNRLTGYIDVKHASRINPTS